MSIETHTTSTESALFFNTTDPKSSLISLNTSEITKLSNTNFLIWHLQVQALFEAHELHVFIIDEDKTPKETITVSGTEQPNPTYTIWKRQDCMLYSSMLGSLSLNIQLMVARAKITREIWTTLSSTYGKSSRAHIKQIKKQLKRCSKGTQSVSEYMRSTPAKADQLALLGSPLEQENLFDIIVDGLGDEYCAVVEMVNGRDTPISTEELHEKLLRRENTLIAVEEILSSSVPVTTNHAQAHQYNQPQRSQNNGNQQFRGNNQNPGGGSFRSLRSYLGKCQICGVYDHSARRYSLFTSSTPQSQQRGSSSPWPTNQLPQSPQQWQHQAHHTTTSPSSISLWLVDSGTSHDIALDLNNLSLHSSYSGGEDVFIGDGRGLSITHTGSTSLLSNSCTLSLDNVFCVPSMK